MDSTTPIDQEPTPIEPSESVAVVRPRKTNIVVIWAVIASVLLGTSAVVRAVQDRRHTEESNWLESCPFPLEELPKTLGQWKSSVDDQKLDSQTMRITGGTDHIIRTYSDESTGVRLVVLILFGPVIPVIPHTPEVCYPANGFQRVEEPINRKITYTWTDPSGKKLEGQKADFRSAVYNKLRLYEGVYHSFRYKGEWTPDVGNRKFPRRSPGVFKVQIQRYMLPNESRDIDKYGDPIEDFLELLIPAIEQKIAEKTATTTTPAKVAAK